MRRTRRRDERGASAVEMVFFLPILFLVILIAVQFAMVYLGNQAASAIARETARVARVTNDGDRAHQAGTRYAQNMSTGILERYDISITPVGDDRVRVTVSGEAQKISPIGVPRVSQTVEGPLEQFVGND